MARGRMISNEIARDKRVNDLSDDTSKLAFTWLVTFADVEGRTYGDPALVRSMLFPRRTDISVEQMESYIQEWQKAGLIIWYEAESDYWIAFPNFEKHQVGLRKDRESPSSIPAPPGYTPPEPTEGDDDNPDNDGRDSGETPDEVPVNLKEVKGKGKEEESSDEHPIHEILDAWAELFPSKPQPKPSTKSYKDKVDTRWKVEDFRENWHKALIEASKSATCQNESWFNFEFFVKNDRNYQKCLEHWMAWKDEKEYGKKSGQNNGRPGESIQETQARLHREMQDAQPIDLR